jgi:hypothetical protein
MLRRLARKAFTSFIAWRARRRVIRTAPELAEIEREIRACRRKHQPTRRLMRAQREIVHAQLKREVERKAS